MSGRVKRSGEPSICAICTPLELRFIREGCLGGEAGTPGDPLNYSIQTHDGTGKAAHTQQEGRLPALTRACGSVLTFNTTGMPAILNNRSKLSCAHLEVY